MLLLKNLPLKKYWCSSYKVLFLYLSVSLNKILTGKVSIPNMIYVYGLKVCTPSLSSQGGGGGGLSLQPNFQKRGLTESQLLEGAAGKDGGDFFQGVGLQFSHNK